MKAAVLALILFCGQYETYGWKEEIDVGFTYFSREWKEWRTVVFLRREDNYCRITYKVWKCGNECDVEVWRTMQQIHDDSDLLKP